MSFRTGTVPRRIALSGVRQAVLAPLFSALMLASVLFVVAFVVLAEEVHESDTLSTDQRVLRAVDNRTASWPVAISNDVGLVASEVGVVVIGVALAAWRFLHRWLDALLFLGAVSGYGVLTLLVKHLVQRERPIAFFRVPESGYSFPSGHTLGATCLAFALGFVLWRSGTSRGLKALGSVALLLGVLVIALSRLMLGVHYPTDVLGSMLLGTAWMSALIALRFAVGRWQSVEATPAPTDE